jgi:hypothetical protein
MPGYIKKKLQKYKQVKSYRVHNCPYSPTLKQYGSKAQAPLPPDQFPRLDKKGIKQVQKIMGSILYYAQAVHMNALMALSTFAVEQMTVTECTLEKCTQ